MNKDFYPQGFPESVIGFIEYGLVNTRILREKEGQLIGDDLFSYLLKKNKADRKEAFDYGGETVHISYYLHPDSDHHTINVDFHYDVLNNKYYDAPKVKRHSFTKSMLDVLEKE